jgi:hypothetical protein
MANFPESGLDKLWNEYSEVFRDFDDLTLGRWLAQTLGQLQGRVWRLSHPLMGAFRLGALLAYERQIWLKQLVASPSNYDLTGCCRAPLLPLFTRDVMESGLVCLHCNASALSFDELPVPLQPQIKDWARRYESVHSVAHQDEESTPQKDPDNAMENAAREAEQLLTYAGTQLLPQFLEYYPAIVWEDQDECLQVRPDDIQLSR